MTEDDIELLEVNARRFRRRILTGFCALLALMFCAFGYMYFADGPPPDDADLLVRDPQVPEEQNGLAQLRNWKNPADIYEFVKRRGLDEKVAHEILQGRKTDDVLVDEFITELQPTFAQLDEILALPYFAFNELLSINGRFTEMRPLLNLSRALALAAEHNQSAGNYDEAVHDVLRLRKLSTRYAEGHVTYSQFATAVLLHETAASATVRLLNDPALPPGARDTLTADWEPYPWTEALRRSIPVQYQFASSILDEIKYHGLAYFGGTRTMNEKLLVEWSRLSVQPNNTRRMLATRDRAWMLALAHPYATIDFSAIEQSWSARLPKSGARYYIAANFGGRAYLASWPIKSTTEIAYTTATISELVRAALAVRHYYDDHHALPPALADLVPQYLPAVPLDPFDGNPLRYDAGRGLIYSIGQSLKDTGGSSRPIDPKWVKQSYDVRLKSDSQPTLDLLFQNPPAPSKPEAEDAK